ncbi:hypothetical protein BG262_04370 [Floricoccus penangensis]|uniref:DUF1648 domain-containing protein n=1 Tax=Floricoccus penangensis TaxID=1859475 RepID=A0A9Q5JFH0_9LACT|nr:DUF1648 domain-containing protein [Floricoccus penangensis]OFI46256.1 hypothetical protein BG262_04370 [Floricoccus penangensis]
MGTQKRYASLDSRTRVPIVATSKYIIVYLIAVVSELIITFAFYDKIPNQIPTHFDALMNPNQFTEKSLSTVLFMPLIQTVMLIIFIVCNEMMKASKIQISSSNPKDSLKINEEVRLTNSKLLFNLFILMQLIFFTVQMMTCFNIRNLRYVMLAILCLTIGYVIVYILMLLKVRKGHSYRIVENKSAWKFGFLYYNKDDVAYIVQKRSGLGYTLNFARYQSWLITLAFILLMLVIVFLGNKFS